jgi:hypothetical protein
MLGGLVGCADGEPATGPAPESSSDAETAASATSEPTHEPTEPASGPEIREPFATLRAPEKWVTENAPLGADAGREPSGGGAALERDVYGFIDVEVDEVDRPLTLEAAAAEAATYVTTEGKRVEDRELGGEPAFVFTQSSAFGDTLFTIGLPRGERIVTLNFSLLRLSHESLRG